MKEIIPAISLLYSIHIKGIVSLKAKKVWQVHADEGVFILKLLPFPAEETGFITDAMTYLSNSGFHRFNEIITTVEGQPTATLDGFHTLLTKELCGRTPDFALANDVTAAATCLHDLHRAAMGFFPAHRYEERIKWGKMIATMESGKDDLLRFGDIVGAKENKDPFDTAFLEHKDFYIQQIEQVCAELRSFYPTLSAAKEKSGGFCHHDPAYHNFFIGEDGMASICDFDYAIADLAAHDVAALLLKILKTNRWDTLLAQTAFAAYQERTPLNKEEIRFLYQLLKYPYDFRHAAFARYEENDASSRIAKKLPRLIREADAREKALLLLEQYFSEES